jgi:hypothetical protein
MTEMSGGAIGGRVPDRVPCRPGRPRRRPHRARHRQPRWRRRPHPRGGRRDQGGTCQEAGDGDREHRRRQRRLLARLPSVGARRDAVGEGRVDRRVRRPRRHQRRCRKSSASSPRSSPPATTRRRSRRSSRSPTRPATRSRPASTATTACSSPTSRKGRGVDAGAVEASYGQGRMLLAGDALRAGMVDRVATVEDTIRAALGSPPGRTRARAELEQATHAVIGAGRVRGGLSPRRDRRPTTALAYPELSVGAGASRPHRDDFRRRAVPTPTTATAAAGTAHITFTNPPPPAARQQHPTQRRSTPRCTTSTSCSRASRRSRRAKQNSTTSTPGMRSPRRRRTSST